MLYQIWHIADTTVLCSIKCRVNRHFMVHVRHRAVPSLNHFPPLNQVSVEFDCDVRVCPVS